MIELYLNGQKADLKDSKIALTKQFKLIEDLSKEVADYTDTIELPMTSNNLRILENSNNVNSVSELLYERISCDYILNGKALIRGGFAYILSIQKGFFVTALYQTKIDFFDAVKDLTLNDLNTGDTILYDFDNVFDSISPAYSFYKFLVMDYTAGGGGFTDNATYFALDARAMVPSINCKYLLDKIAERTGIAIDSTGEVAALYLTGNCIDIKRDAKFNSVMIQQTGGLPGTYQLSTSEIELPLSIKTGSNAKGNGFVCPQSGKYEFSYNYAYSCSQDDAIVINIYKNGVFLTTVNDGIFPTSNLTPSVIIQGKINAFQLDAGDVITFKYSITEIGNSVFISNSYITRGSGGRPSNTERGDVIGTFIYLSAYQVVPNYYGQTLSIDAILPNIKVSDFIKMITSLTGTVFVSRDNQLYLEYLDYFFARDTVDWSDKFISLESIETNLDFAKINHFKYKKDEEGNPYGIGNADLSIANEQLDLEKTIIELPVAGCSHNNMIDAPYLTGFCVANYYTVPAPQNFVFQSKSQPRIFKLGWYNSNAKKILLVDGVEQQLVDEFNCYVATFANSKESLVPKYPSTNIDFNTVLIKKYELMKSVLSASKKITAYFNLTESDFDIDIQPIYVQQLNAYFYLNRIVDFIPGQPTKVELLMVILTPPPAFDTTKYLQAENGQYILTEEGQLIEID